MNGYWYYFKSDIHDSKYVVDLYRQKTNDFTNSNIEKIEIKWPSNIYNKFSNGLTDTIYNKSIPMIQVYKNKLFLLIEGSKHNRLNTSENKILLVTDFDEENGVINWDSTKEYELKNVGDFNSNKISDFSIDQYGNFTYKNNKIGTNKTKKIPLKDLNSELPKIFKLTENNTYTRYDLESTVTYYETELAMYEIGTEEGKVPLNKKLELYKYLNDSLKAPDKDIYKTIVGIIEEFKNLRKNLFPGFGKIIKNKILNDVEYVNYNGFVWTNSHNETNGYKFKILPFYDFVICTITPLHIYMIYIIHHIAKNYLHSKRLFQNQKLLYLENLI